MDYIKKLTKTNKNVFWLLFAVGIIAYLNVINGDFIWDEFGLIVQNPDVTGNGSLGHLLTSSPFNEADNLYRPVYSLVNFFLYAIFGLHTWGYHLFSLLIHVLNCYLIFVFATKFLKFSRTGSLLASLVFLLHPVQTESVSYIAGLPEPLGTLFVLLGLFFYAESLKEKNPFFRSGKFWGALAMFALAVLTKESMVVFSGLALLLTIFVWPELDKSAQKKAPFAALVVILFSLFYVFLKFKYLHANEEISFVENNAYTESLWVRMITFSHTLWDYAVLLVAPIHLNFDKPYVFYTSLISTRGLAGAGILLVAIAVSLWSLLKEKKVFLAVGWFFIALLPYMGFIPVNAIIFEHWLYLPLTGGVLLMPVFYDTFKNGTAKKILSIVLIVILLLFLGKTIIRNNDWANADRFFANELTYNSESARIYNAMAKSVSFYKNDIPTAIEYVKKSIELDPDNKMYRINLIQLYVFLQDWNQVIQLCSEYILIDQNSWESYDWLYHLYLEKGDAEKSEVFKTFSERVKNGEKISKEEVELALSEMK